ncbi:MAG TPA: hypothetical protein VG961_03740, partial [Ignavibacteria bacterium]|nr:hypothetical protein [Ignavibacteria bacterium]
MGSLKKVNIETIRLNELPPDIWQKYYEMIQQVRRKYYPEIFNPYQTAAEMSREWFKYYEAYKGKSFEQHAIFCDDVPVGWVGYTLDNCLASFNFEADSDEISHDLLKVMLGKVNEYMSKHDLKDIYHWTFVDRKIAVLKGINAEIHEKMINTRVKRSEMDTNFYNSIISSCDITGYRLMFYEELPEEL